MALSKQVSRELYRPLNGKVIQLGSITPNLATGGNLSFNQQVDLSLPIRGFQIQFKGRDVVAGAGMASITPEGFLDFITNITIAGVNARQQGNLTLWSASLSTIYATSFLTAESQGTGTVTINSGTGDVLQPRPGVPFATPPFYNPTGATGTFDFRITVNIPMHGFRFNGFGMSPFATPLFAVRNEEWKDSIQLLFTVTGQPNGALAGALGTGAAATTHTFSAFGSATGSPTIDIYSLPFLSGLTSKDSYLPGVLSRVNFPVSTVLQQTGNNVTIMNLQKQPTPRIYIKQGTSTVPEVFATLSDNIITQVGIQLGGNRNIRNTIDIQSHKTITSEEYSAPPIQGYTLLDFVQQGNYDASFPGQDIGDGASFVLNGNVAGTPNAAADILQEQNLHLPTGPLAS